MAAAALSVRMGVSLLNKYSKFSRIARGASPALTARYISITNVLRDRRFTVKHEFIDVVGTVGTVGITDFAQKELGDVVFVELPAIGGQIEKDAVLCTMESVKAVAEVYAPVSGVVREINGELVKQPGLVNKSPYEEGWLVKLDLTTQQLEAAAKLMDAAAYDKYLKDH